MTAYVVVDTRVTDPERFRVYQGLAEQALVEYGGRFLARGGASEVLEGEWSPPRLVVLEFPDVAAAKGWYECETYRQAREARKGAAVFNMVVVEGVPPA